MPSPNIPPIITFLLIGICRPHNIGIGNTTNVISSARLRIGYVRSYATPLPHEVHETVLSQEHAMGAQIRHLARTSAMEYATLRNSTAKQVRRNDRVEKMRM